MVKVHENRFRLLAGDELRTEYQFHTRTQFLRPPILLILRVPMLRYVHAHPIWRQIFLHNGRGVVKMSGISLAIFGVSARTVIENNLAGFRIDIHLTRYPCLTSADQGGM